MKFVSLPEEEFVKDSINIIEKAKDMGITIRIIGALAVYIHSIHYEKALALYKKVKRFGEDKPMFTDLDLMAYGKQRNDIAKFFEKTLHFKPNFMINALFGDRRMIFLHPEGHYHVDVFFDKLEFSHDVYVGSKPGHGRLELDYPTISLADLVLQKTQIHHINLKDIVDLIVLFVSHDVDDTVQDRELIDGKYVARVLADDWGFWYDAVNNLEKVKEFSKKFHLENKLTKEEYSIVISRVDKLLNIIDETPKTKKWLKRAKNGTSKPWYRVVEEVER